jgi:hypothetical protein
LLLTSSVAQATIFNIPDGNVPALIAAIMTANANGQDDVINLAPSGTYLLEAADNATNGPTGLPVIASDAIHSVVVNGNGATIRRSTAAGTPDFRILQLGSASNVTLSDLIIANGNATGGYPQSLGGAIYNDHGSLTLSSCTLNANNAGYGGGLLNDGSGGTANLTVTNSTISGNGAAGSGGGIYCDNNGGNVAAAISNCRFTGNTAAGYGGGFLNYFGSQPVTLNDCTLSSNQAHGLDATGIGSGGSCGGGAATNGGTLIFNRCTFDGNGALGGDGGDNVGLKTTGGDGGEGQGGGVFNEPGADLMVKSCTFFGNIATGGRGGRGNFGGPGGGGDGAGIFNQGTMSVSACTLSGNSGTGGAGGAGSSKPNKGVSGIGSGGLTADSGSSTVGDTISARNIGNNGGGRDVHGAFTSAGHNLIGSGDGSTGFGGNGDQLGMDLTPKDPKLDPNGLQDNGGLTQTIAILSNSPEINNGDNNAPPLDQRGYLRSGVPDIGAFEFGGKPLRITSIVRLSGGNVVIQGLGVPNEIHTLHVSPDLTAGSFKPLQGHPTAIADATGALQFVDTEATGLTKRFYRIGFP